MGKIYAGVSDTAREVKKIYAGVNGVAKEIKKVYAGVNGVAKLIWQSDNLSKVYLFYHGDACTDITGGWTKAFTFKTANGSNYTMTRLAVGPDALAGNRTSTGGTGEYCLYVRTVNSIDFTNYSKLCFLYEYKMPTFSSGTPQCRVGAFGSSYTDMRWSGYDSRFLAFEEITNVKQSDYVSTTVEVDVSGVNESADVLFYCAFSNMKASYYVRFPEIWLE